MPQYWTEDRYSTSSYLSSLNLMLYKPIMNYLPTSPMIHDWRNCATAARRLHWSRATVLRSIVLQLASLDPSVPHSPCDTHDPHRPLCHCCIDSNSNYVCTTSAQITKRRPGFEPPTSTLMGILHQGCLLILRIHLEDRSILYQGSYHVGIEK